MSTNNKRTFIFMLAAATCIVSIGIGDNLIYDRSTNATTTAAATISVEQVSLSRVESNIRRAAVKIVDLDNEGHGSGTYFVINSRHVVFTAAHVVDTADIFTVVGNYGEISIGSVIYRNDKSDFAVLGIQRMDSIKPIKYKHKEMTKSQLIGEDVFYSGFPAQHNVISTRGMVVGFEDGSSFLLVHSYAWKGSSGSCVFNRSGNLLGILVGLDVGTFEVPQLTEDMIWVSAIRSSDIEALMNILE